MTGSVKLKKYLALTFLSFIFLFLLLLLFSWLSGSGIRISDGRYLGYSSSTDEMLFIEYQNTLVKQDGPYVITKGEKHLAINITSTEQQINQVTTTQVQDQVVVTADNKNKTQFSVPLRNNYARSNLIYSTEEKVLAISDVEGNFNAMVDLLSASGVINESLAWSFNKGHLVLIGDMVDRGINVLPTL